MDDYRLILVICILLCVVWRIATKKRRLRRTAKEISEDVGKTYDSGFRWKSVDLNAFKQLDQVFYHKTTEFFYSRGYHVVGDVEYLHVTEGNPNCKTCVRLMASDEGNEAVAIFNIRIRGWQKWLLKLTGNATDYRTVELQSVLSGGRFIMTNNTGDLLALSKPKKVMVYTAPTNISAAALLRMHQANVSQFCTEAPDAPKLCKMRTLEEILHYEEIQHEVCNKHRKESSTLTAGELDRLGKDLTENEKSIILDELKKVQ